MNAAQAIKIKRFENVTVGPATMLLRISGKPRRRWGSGQRPTLRIGGEQGAHRFAAIPAPADPRGLLRAAYAVPSALLGPDSRFWLEYGDGSLTELPNPTPGLARDPAARAATRSRPTSVSPEPDLAATFADRPAPVDNDRRGTVLEKFAEQSEALAQSEQAAARRRREAVSAQDLLATLEQRNHELEVSLDEHQQRIILLDRQISDAAASPPDVAAPPSGRTIPEADFKQCTDQLRAMTGERDELSRQVAELDRQAAEASQRADQAKAAHEQLRADLDELEIWRDELERRLAATTSEVGYLKTAREADQRELEALRSALARAQAAPGRSEQREDKPSVPSFGEGAGSGAREPDVELISRAAERAAREQAERELRGARWGAGRGGRLTR